MAIQAPGSGQVLGHYRLIEQIGAGGMGVVFRARDEQLQRDVAVKILPAGLFADDAARKQFRKEALAVARLNHPNIAMAFDFGEENGVDYLVTEYISGLNLDEMLAQQTLPQKTVLELGLQLTSGLEAAHRENVVHRDLKPGNLRVNPDGQLKILDFGLAKLVEPIEVAETANLNTSLSLSGTVPYMAPELLRAETADARSDIWAAGAVLYEMATGKRAFPDRQPSLLIDAILHYDPVRLCLLNPEVSAALETVILKALDREPDLRYQSARDLRADLKRILGGDELSTETLRRTTVFKVERRARNRKATLLLAAVLLVGVAAGYGVKRWWPAPVSTQQRIMAVLPFDTVGQDPATSALGLGLAETLTAKLVQASDTDAIQVVSPRDLRDQGVKTAEDARREFGTDFVLESSLQRSDKTIRINCFLVDSKTHRQVAARSITVDANDTFGLQDRVVSETLDMLPAQIKPEQRRKLNVRQDTQPAAYEAYIRGRGYLQEYQKPENIENAIAEFNEALKIDPSYALAYAGLGKAYLTGFQQFDKGQQWVANASANCEKALSLNSGLLEGHICLGNVLNGTGKYNKAVEEFQVALRSEPSSEDALRGLADAYTNLGNFAAAESTYKKVIALRPNYWGVYSWLGSFYYNQARYPEAAEMFLKATQLAPDNYHGYLNLGGTYGLQGRYSEAIDALKRSIELRPSPDAYNNLGYVYTLLHRFPEAIAALDQALKIDDSDWMNWGNLGDALYWSPNQRLQSSAKYRQAVKIGTSRLQINPSDADTLAYLANYSAMLDDRQAAFDYVRRALELAPSNGEVLFRAAIVYNHFGQTDQALAYLKKGVDVGYSRTIIRDTPDFQGLQQNAQFRTLAGVSQQP
jgi:eukaryotic-like serine/threonine-protein kinase